MEWERTNPTLHGFDATRGAEPTEVCSIWHQLVLSRANGYRWTTCPDDSHSSLCECASLTVKEERAGLGGWMTEAMQTDFGWEMVRLCVSISLGAWAQ